MKKIFLYYIANSIIAFSLYAQNISCSDISNTFSDFEKLTNKIDKKKEDVINSICDGYALEYIDSDKRYYDCVNSGIVNIDNSTSAKQYTCKSDNFIYKLAGIENKINKKCTLHKLYYKNDNADIFYTIKKNPNNSWTSVRIKELVYFKGKLDNKTIYEAKQNKDGTWTSVIKDYFSFHSDGSVCDHDKWAVKQNADGNWVSIYLGGYSYYENGKLFGKSTSVAKQNKDGTWTSVYLYGITYHDNGSPEDEQKAVAKQNRDGTWTSVLIKHTLWYYKNGNLKEKTEYLYEPKQDKDGNWHSVEKINE